ncbi:MAG: hypothetical protein ACKVVO_08175 [Opitutaceae bacterium]
MRPNFIRTFSKSVSSPRVSSNASPPFTRLWSGATAGHRRTGGDDYTSGDGLKTLWLKASWLAAAVLLRGPLAKLPPDCCAAQPIAAMGVPPVKLAQVESLYAAFARVPDPHRRRVGNAWRP